jgi:integrase
LLAPSVSRLHFVGYGVSQCIENAVWTVPAVRMKAGREHRVPLSQRALAIIQVTYELRNGDLVFPSARHPGKPLAVRSLWRVMRGMKGGDATVHGFRSAFRDWAAECTNFPNEVCEAALAHSVANKVEAAYRRGDLFEKRRKLMDAWADYCSASKSGAVLAFRYS